MYPHHTKSRPTLTSWPSRWLLVPGSALTGIAVEGEQWQRAETGDAGVADSGLANSTPNHHTDHSAHLHAAQSDHAYILSLLRYTYYIQTINNE